MTAEVTDILPMLVLSRAPHGPMVHGFGEMCITVQMFEKFGLIGHRVVNVLTVRSATSR